MRYTRYEYKRLNKMKFICTIILVAGISIGGGLYVSGFIFNQKEIPDNNSSNLGYSIDESNNGNIQNIIILQCGYYSKEENAKELMNSLEKYCQPFIIEEEGKYRVLAGIYKEEDSLKKIDEFKSKNIDFTKATIKISGDNLENKKLIEIADGFLSILNKLQDNGIKSIKTAEFKEWADKIINDDSNGIKSKKIEDLNNYVKSLPDEIDKTNCNTNIEELYKLIKN